MIADDVARVIYCTDIDELVIAFQRRGGEREAEEFIRFFDEPAL